MSKGRGQCAAKGKSYEKGRTSGKGQALEHKTYGMCFPFFLIFPNVMVCLQTDVWDWNG